MHNSSIDNFQPGLKPNSEPKADEMQVSPAIGNTNVGCSLCCSSPKKNNMNQEFLFSETTIITVNYYGEKPKDKSFKVVKSREKKVSVNGDLVYTEWQSWPQFHHKENTSVALENLESQLSLRNHSSSSKQSSDDSRNFAQTVKMVWAKFLFKMFNFKS